MEIEKKIEGLELKLPEAPKPVASCVTLVHSGSFAFTPNQLPYYQGGVEGKGESRP